VIDPLQPTPADARPRPWVQLKYFTFHPSVYPRMVGANSGGIAGGSEADIYDKDDCYFGRGFFNAGARAPLRVFHHGRTAPPPDLLEQRIDQAVALRHGLLGLGDPGGACRLVHSDGDGLPGLVVDRYADTLSIEVTTLGAWRRLGGWLPRLHAAAGTRRARVRVDPEIAMVERIPGGAVPGAGEAPRGTRFSEHGVRYEVSFEDGHKTGFFCDQRGNRRRLGEWSCGRRVLDLCCYTGGFALAARVLGGCEDVTGVDLDEKAIARAKRNANLNQARVNWVHADAFTYLRQMQRNGTTWPVVVVDPPKFIAARDAFEEGRRKYHDLNVLAAGRAEPGGLFVTCSCSGLLGADEFEDVITKAVHRSGRRLQILARSGAGPDHPVMSNCPESRYLKVLWATVW
jgi:23S rRNA (cytosine1962-C5)-methyltransferase